MYVALILRYSRTILSGQHNKRPEIFLDSSFIKQHKNKLSEQVYQYRRTQHPPIFSPKSFPINPSGRRHLRLRERKLRRFFRKHRDTAFREI